MKKLLSGFTLSFVAFLVGYNFVPQYRKAFVDDELRILPAAEQTEQQETMAPSITPTNQNVNFVPEFRDLPNEIGFSESTNSLIDVFETDGIYRESEVIAKSGETWLTLFEQKRKYSLILAKAKVQKKRTISYSGDEYDVHLSFDKPGVPLFAVKNIKHLKPGPITTLYHRPSSEEIERRNLPIDSMKLGFRREFNLNESWYTLRVSLGLNKDGIEMGILVLEHNGVAQVIAQNYDEIIGDLFWAGDSDNDGKLDLYFDEFNEKGYFGVSLYLSSEAEKGKLVKVVATFGTAGC
jgi:hypothetical protein